jgi:hypothetical protein
MDEAAILWDKLSHPGNTWMENVILIAAAMDATYERGMAQGLGCIDEVKARAKTEADTEAFNRGREYERGRKDA